MRTGLKIVSLLVVFVLLFLYHWAYSFDQLLSSAIAFACIDLLGFWLNYVFINRFLIPVLLYQKRNLLFVFLLPLGFILSSLLIQQVELVWFDFMKSLSAEARPVFRSFTFQVFNTYLVQFLGSVSICAYRLSKDQLLSQMRYETLQKEKAQTELNFLKAQVNPHFLFNSINSLYAEIDKTNVRARDIVLKFSEMLRYQLYECNVDKIAIEKETDYLRNYVELERLRKEEALQLKFELTGNMHGFEIAPLIFITFIENAFKYISNHEHKTNHLEIHLGRQDQTLLFKCCNTKDTVLGRSLLEDRGIGIKNVKRRLELLYPGKHELLIEDGEDRFSISLKLQLQ